MTNKHKLHSNKNNWIVLMILLVIFIGLSVWTGFMMYKYYNVRHSEESSHYMFVTVDTSKNLTYAEALGYSTDPTKITYNIMQQGSIFFRTLSPGLSFYKEVDIMNRNKYPVEFSYKTSGNISEFITVEVPKNILGPQESITLNVSIAIPESGVVSGYYGGNLTVKLTPVED